MLGDEKVLKKAVKQWRKMLDSSWPHSLHSPILFISVSMVLGTIRLLNVRNSITDGRKDEKNTANS